MPLAVSCKSISSKRTCKKLVRLWRKKIDPFIRSSHPELVSGSQEIKLNSRNLLIFTIYTSYRACRDIC